MKMHRALILAAAAALALSACSRGGGHAPAGNATAPAVSGEAAKNEAAGAAFLAKNAKEPGVMTTASGLQYKVVHEGPAGGAHPRPQDEVKVNYEGTLLDGKVFDSSYKSGQPVIFTLGNLVPGWVEGIQLMKPGDEFLLYVPAKLGYGDEDNGSPIPPGSTLVFRIELLGVLQHDQALG
jgi:peptidylprolyl isomerase/FKBP-type peptidyl-prolyl cis-trans isomerase FklB